MRFMTILIALLSLSACADTIAETEESFTHRGETYRSVVRTFQRDDGTTYQRRAIYVGAERVTCRADDRRSCELALSDLFVRDR